MKKYSVMRSFLFYIFAYSFIFSNSAQAVPPLQSYEALDAEPFRFMTRGELLYPDGQDDLKQTAMFFLNQLSEVGLEWSAVAGDVNNNLNHAIRLHHLKEGPVIPYGVNDKRFKESYRIVVGSNIDVYVGGLAGGRYAVQRIMSLLDNNTLKAASIIDYPDYRWRGAVVTPKHTKCKDLLPLKKKKQQLKWLGCMKKKIDKLALMRINLLGLISPVFHRINNDDVYLLEGLFKYARQKNIEIMPVVASKLWGVPKSILKTDAIEAVYHQQVPFRVQNNRLVSLSSSRNLILNGNFDELGISNWKTRNRPWAPAWELVDGGVGNKPGNKYLSIQLSKKNNPWKSAANPTDSSGRDVIPVEPGQYYELGLDLKTSGYHVGRLRVGVEEYDENRQRIPELNRYHVKIIGTKGWSKRWVPFFTSNDTHYLKLKIAPDNLINNDIDIDIDNIDIRLMQNQLINVLINEETRPVVQSGNGKIIYENGKDYELTKAPIMQWRDTAFSDIERLEVRVIPGSRIAEGDVVKINFDSLLLEYRNIPRSKYSAASKYTYIEFHRIFKQLNKLSPLFVHIALSEHIGGLNRDSRSLGIGLSNRDLLISYLNTLNSIMKDNKDVILPNGEKIKGLGAENTTLMLWDDMVNPWYSGGEDNFQVSFGGITGATKLSVDNKQAFQLNDSVYLSGWWYKDKDTRGIVKNAPEFYYNAGYKYFAATWYQKGGIKNWFETWGGDQIEGVLATTWNKKEAGVPIVACAGWNRKAHKICAANR